MLRWRESTGRRVPVYARVLEEIEALLAEEAGLGERLAAAWAGRVFPALYDRPLLILAAIRFDAIAVGAAHPLARAMARTPPDPEAVTRQAVAAALAREAFWREVGGRRVQTNETSRALAWRLPAALAGCSEGARPLALFDMGCSAGMNLIADALTNIWTEEGSGRPVAVSTRERIVLRAGFDSNPLDARREEDARWLRACVWPSEMARLSRLQESISAMQKAEGVSVEALDLADAPARVGALCAALPAGALALAYQSIVRDYLPGETREAYYAGMRSWLRSRPPGTAAWAELEMVEGRAALPAGITVHARGAGGEIESALIARCDYHPRAVAIDGEAAERVRRLLRG